MSIHDPRDINFYEPPATAIEPSRSFKDDGFGLFLTWEKLRLVYNGILLMETVGLLIAVPSSPSHLASLPIGLFLCCFAANVCFCLGPVLNFYARWVGFRHVAVTLLLFASGTLFAMLVTLVAVLEMVGMLILHNSID